jgi:thiol-disulfide isomerase/thioredoxin
MKYFTILFAIAATAAFAQEPPKNTPQDPEQQELMQALSDANSSTVDLVRILEAFLKKHPQTAQRKEIERVLAKSAIENRDDRRTVLYGEKMLETNPEDMLVLDRVARSLLALGGRENAQKSLKYSRAFEEFVIKLAPAEGRDVARRQEERDRGQARALLFQSRAKSELGEKEEAVKLAEKSFSVYPCEEGARHWSKMLEAAGRNEEALLRLAEAFTVPDSRATDADRQADRTHLGELYKRVHSSEKGMGDMIVAAYDRMVQLSEERKRHLHAIDPNFNVTEPMQFTLTGLDGTKFPLSNLLGKVVVVDFWATWCQPCRTQHPLYEEVKKKFKDRSDVVFLSIDTDEDRSQVGPFLDQMQWSRTVYFEDGLQRLLQVNSIPTTMLFDKQGRVASRMNGFLPETFVQQVSERIESALAAAP